MPSQAFVTSLACEDYFDENMMEDQSGLSFSTELVASPAARLSPQARRQTKFVDDENEDTFSDTHGLWYLFTLRLYFMKKGRAEAFSQ